MLKSIITEFDSFYFVGIGGVSMSALAKILSESGKTVAGYDRSDGEYVHALKSDGIEVSFDTHSDISLYDCVVYTDAVAGNNPIILSAKRLNKPVISRGELLAEMCKSFNFVTAVAGCHGKTTCTAMLAHIYDAAGLGFSAHIGGTDLKFTNGYLKGYDYFVTEACEYKKNFLALTPDLGVILNSDADHLDCYGTAENLKRAYDGFAANSKTAIRLYGDGKADITFGLDDRADYFAKKVRGSRGNYSFIAYENGKELGKVTLGAAGKHNVLNALAAIAAARSVKLNFEYIAEGLNSFSGVKRRFENIGTIRGVQCIADYAHHPNEIRAALKTARQVTEGELFVIFQPHTYSRTKNLFKDFVSVLSTVKKVLIYKTYAAREYYDDAGSALTLSSAVKRSRYADCPQDILDFTRHATAGDLILFLGAGDIYDIANSLTDC